MRPRRHLVGVGHKLQAAELLLVFYVNTLCFGRGKINFAVFIMGM